MLFAADRGRASPYHPSDRRFLDPLLIDALDDAGLPRDAALDGGARRARPSDRGAAARPTSTMRRCGRSSASALAARFAAFQRARAARPDDPLFADYARFVAAGGDALRRFAAFQAIAETRGGEDWRRWPADAARRRRRGARRGARRARRAVPSRCSAQWLADRQLAAAAARARPPGSTSASTATSRSARRPTARRAGRAPASSRSSVSVGAPPDPFSAKGQVWNVPPPDPIASARDGWRGFAALLAANMRHAGMLRIDHAMGLTRLFVVPDGAKPAEGAYLAYPLDDLLGQVALESQRAGCMVVGEDLGTVPDGFRDKLTRADMLGLRVLWFERRGAEFLQPADYPVLSIACVSTHDLPTLAGWWSGADIAERLALGLLNLDDAEGEIAERRAEKQRPRRRAGRPRADRRDAGLRRADVRRARRAPSTLSSPAPARCWRARSSTISPARRRDQPAGHRPRAAELAPSPARDVEALFASTRAHEILTAMSAPRR